MEFTPQGILVHASEIGQVTAEQIFEFGVSPLEFDEGTQLMVGFENGPEAAFYSLDTLRHLLDLMTMSRSEGDILRKLKIVPGYRGHLPPAWKDLVLFDGNGNYLVHDVWLDEIMVVTIAKRLHNYEDYREHHSVVIVPRSKLPDTWKEGESVGLNRLYDIAEMVVHGDVINFIRVSETDHTSSMLGNLVLVYWSRDYAHRAEIIMSTRLRPEMVK